MFEPTIWPVILIAFLLFAAGHIYFFVDSVRKPPLTDARFFILMAFSSIGCVAGVWLANYGFQFKKLVHAADIAMVHKMAGTGAMVLRNRMFDSQILVAIFSGAALVVVSFVIGTMAFNRRKAVR